MARNAPPSIFSSGFSVGHTEGIFYGLIFGYLGGDGYPFNHDAVDLPAVKRPARHLLDAGIEGSGGLRLHR